MTPDRWQRINEIYQSLLERDPDQQEAFLKTACAGDESLLDEVKSLMAGAKDADEFLKSPAAAFRNAEASQNGKAGIDLTGRLLSHYRILQKIGAGGMGVIFLARDEHLQRDVAVKMLPAGTLADEPARKRFRNEALALSKLNHANIETVHDFDTRDGIDFLVTEYLSGPTLRDRLSQGSLPETEVIVLGMQLAAALEEAHEKGVIHRDLKPSNIILTAKGQLKILDFGLARLLHPAGEALSTDSYSASMRIAGTLPYMAPEQLRGEALEPRSDLFSFGAVLYEMATGRRAFTGNTSAVVCDAILNRTPPAPARLNPGLSADLERIIHKALEKIPENRYHYAKEMLVDLRRCSSQSALSTLKEEQPRGPAKSAVIKWAAIAVSAAAVLTLAWRVFLPARQPLPHFRDSITTKTAGWEGDPEVSPDGSMVLYSSNVSGKHEIFLSNADGTEAKMLVDDGTDNTSPTWFPDQKAVAFASERDGVKGIWKLNLPGGVATLLIPNAQDPAISPDGRHIAFARPSPSGYRRIGVASLSNPSDVTVLTSDRDGIWDHDNPAWSPEGKEICYWSRHGLWIVALAGGPARRLTPGYELDLAPVWSHDGRYIYFCSHRNGSPHIWRVKSRGGEPEQLTLGSGPESHPSLPWDGGKLYYTTSTMAQQIVLLNRRTGAETLISDSESEYMASLAADGSGIVYSSDRGGTGNLNLWIQDLANGRISGAPRKLTRFDDIASNPALSPDNKWVAFYRIIRGQRDIWIVANPTGETFQVTDHPAADIHPAWSPDGSQLAFISERSGWRDIWIVPVSDGRSTSPPRELATYPVSAYAPAWSPDGGTIAFPGETEGRAEIWLIAANGGAQPQKITSGAEVKRVRWDYSTGDLLASAAWAADRVSLWRFSPKTRTGRPFSPAIEFGGKEAPGLFDISRDGQLLLFTRAGGTKGHIRALDAPNFKF